MKSIIYSILMFMCPVLLLGQTIVEHQSIIETFIDVSSITTVGQVTINPTVSGKVIVKFDGYCESTPGDRIVLAASNTQFWSPDDGNVGVEAVDSDLPRNSFSHTRVYDITPGSQTFYAIAHNWVEFDGDGIASIYGSLTVEFFPDNSETSVEHQGITQNYTDVSTITTLGQITINPTVPGKVIVSFNGICLSTPGDRIVLAASNTQSWSPDDGNVGVEAIDSDLNSNNFSHTRVYDISPGSQTFYAVAHNWVETDGDGMAAIFGSLKVEFFPNNNENIVEHQSISQTNIDVSAETTVEQITINPTVPGKVIVNFDGACISTPGDRIVLAASNTQFWSPSDGSVSVMAIDSDINNDSFSHTRVYDINPGSQTFYAIAHNYVNTDGDGIASIYGSLTVKFYPDFTLSIDEPEIKQEITFYPNPSNDVIQIFGLTETEHYKIYNNIGAEINKGMLSNKEKINIEKLTSGLYFLHFETRNSIKFIKK